MLTKTLRLFGAEFFISKFQKCGKTMSKNQEYIPALGYAWLTGFYDSAVKITMPEKKFRRRLIDELALEKTDKVLEFGFGTGQNLILAKQRLNEAEIVGLDVDPKVKAIAERKIERENLTIPLFLYDGEVFPFDDASFDKVYSSLVFHQLAAIVKKRCLREIKRVLKPSGSLIIGDWGKPKSKLMRFAFYGVQLLDGFETTDDNVKGLLPEFMKESGFRNVEEVGFINTSVGAYCFYRGLK